MLPAYLALVDQLLCETDVCRFLVLRFRWHEYRRHVHLVYLSNHYPAEIARAKLREIKPIWITESHGF